MNCIECGIPIENKSFSAKLCSEECAYIRQRRQTKEAQVVRRKIDEYMYVEEWNVLMGKRLPNGRISFQCLTCKNSGEGHKNWLESKKSTPCTVCKPPIVLPENFITGTTPIPKAFLRNLHARAMRRGIEIDVDEEYLWRIFLNQGGKCALSGVDLVFEARSRDTASLDKINSEGGYTKGNVQWLTLGVNVAKGLLSVEEYINVCSLVVKKHSSTCISTS